MILLNTTIPVIFSKNITRDAFTEEFLNILFRDFNIQINDLQNNQNEEFYDYEIISNDKKYFVKLFKNGIATFNYNVEINKNSDYDDIVLNKEYVENSLRDHENKFQTLVRTLNEAASIAFPKLSNNVLYNNSNLVSLSTNMYLKGEEYLNDLALSILENNEISFKEYDKQENKNVEIIKLDKDLNLFIGKGAKILVSISSKDKNNNLDDDLIWNKFLNDENYVQYLKTGLFEIDKLFGQLIKSINDVDYTSALSAAYEILFAKNEITYAKKLIKQDINNNLFNILMNISKIEILNEAVLNKTNIVKNKSKVSRLEKMSNENKQINASLQIVLLLLAVLCTGLISLFFENNMHGLIFFSIATGLLVLCFAIVYSSNKKSNENVKLNAKKGKLKKYNQQKQIEALEKRNRRTAEENAIIINNQRPDNEIIKHENNVEEVQVHEVDIEDIEEPIETHEANNNAQNQQNFNPTQNQQYSGQFNPCGPKAQQPTGPFNPYGPQPQQPNPNYQQGYNQNYRYPNQQMHPQQPSGQFSPYGPQPQQPTGQFNPYGPRNPYGPKNQ